MRRKRLEKIIIEELQKEGIKDMLSAPGRWLMSPSDPDAKELDVAGESPVNTWTRGRKTQAIKDFKSDMNKNLLPALDRALSNAKEIGEKLGTPNIVREVEKTRHEFQAILNKMMDKYYPPKIYGQTGKIGVVSEAGPVSGASQAALASTRARGGVAGAGGADGPLTGPMKDLVAELYHIKEFFYKQHQQRGLFYMLDEPTKWLNAWDELWKRIEEKIVAPLTQVAAKAPEEETPTGGEPVPGEDEAPGEAGDAEGAVPINKYAQAKDPKTGKRLQPLSSKLAKAGLPKQAVKIVMRNIIKQLQHNNIPMTESLMTKIGVMLTEKVILYEQYLQERKGEEVIGKGDAGGENPFAALKSFKVADKEEAPTPVEVEEVPDDEQAEQFVQKKALMVYLKKLRQKLKINFDPSSVRKAVAKVLTSAAGPSLEMREAAETPSVIRVMDLQKALANALYIPAEEGKKLSEDDAYTVAKEVASYLEDYKGANITTEKPGDAGEEPEKIDVSRLIKTSTLEEYGEIYTQLLKQAGLGPDKATPWPLIMSELEQKGWYEEAVQRITRFGLTGGNERAHRQKFIDLARPRFAREEAPAAKGPPEKWVTQGGTQEEWDALDRKEKIVFLKMDPKKQSKFFKMSPEQRLELYNQMQPGIGASDTGAARGAERTAAAQAAAGEKATERGTEPEKGTIKISTMNQQLRTIDPPIDDATRKKTMNVVRQHLAPYLKKHGLRLSEQQLKEFKLKLLQEFQKRELLK